MLPLQIHPVGPVGGTVLLPAVSSWFGTSSSSIGSKPAGKGSSSSSSKPQMQTASVDVTPLFQGKKHGPNIWKKPGENFQLSSFVILEAAITRKKSVNFTGDMAWTCLKERKPGARFHNLKHRHGFVVSYVYSIVMLYQQMAQKKIHKAHWIYVTEKPRKPTTDSVTLRPAWFQTSAANSSSTFP